MKAEERFVNKEKLKLYLNVDDSDLRDVTPNHHNLKEVGKNAGLVLNIRWEKNMIYKSLTVLTHFLIQTFLPIFRFKVHLSYASFKEVLGSLYVHLLCPAHSYLRTILLFMCNQNISSILLFMCNQNICSPSGAACSDPRSRRRCHRRRNPQEIGRSGKC